MKHNIKITLLLAVMFLVSQLIGIAVIHAYSPRHEQVINATTGVVENITIEPQIPYGMQPPKVEANTALFSIIISILIATALFFLLRRVKANIILRLWFFAVVVLALGISFNAFLSRFFAGPVALLSVAIALPLAFNKTFNQNMIVHNLTELFIYPGIAAIFVPILNIWTGIVLLIAISIYDIYAVWKSKFMQKLAKFQIQQLKIFAGFFVPYMRREDRVKIQKLRSLASKGRKEKRVAEQKLKKSRIRVNLAILGGGDVAFPLIFAGILLRASGLIPALIVVLFSTISLLLLFVFAKKGKFYPAMPFLSAGCIAGWLVSLLV